MKHFKRSGKRLFALLLCLCMLATMAPIALADSAEGSVRIDEDNAAVSWTGTWGPWTEDGETIRYTNEIGASVTLSFNGTGVAVYGQKAPNGPYMSVTIDGVDKGKADYYQALPKTDHNALVWQISGLEAGDHTMTMTMLDENSGVVEKWGGYSNPQAVINYFLVTNEPGSAEEPDPDNNVADGAIHDEWYQDPATVKGDDSVCDVQNGMRHLKAGTGNKNGATDTTNNPYPAVFIDKTMSEALAKVGADEPAFLEFTLERISEHASNYTQFGVYLNYQDPGNALFVGCDAGGWFWQTLTSGNGPWYSGSRVALPAVGQAVTVRLEWTGTSLTKATIDGADMFPDMPLDFSAAGGNSDTKGVVGFKAGCWANPTEYYLTNVTYTGQSVVEGRKVSGTVKDSEDNAVAGALVTVQNKQALTNETGAFTIAGLTPGEYTLNVTKEGYTDAQETVTVGDTDVTGVSVTLNAIQAATETLSSEEMAVLVDKNFPRVISYTMKDGKVFQGQPNVLSAIRINNVDVMPTVTSTVSGSKITYTMSAKDVAHHIDCTITADMEVKENTLEFHITDVTYTDESSRTAYPVESIEIPNHSLISVRSSQADAKLDAARLGGSTIQSGDVFYDVTGELNVASLNGQSYMYTFLSNSQLSAGISSNSDVGAGAAAGDNYRLKVSAWTSGADKVVGVGSSLWYYDRKISSSDATQASYANLTDAQKVVGIRQGVDEMPYVKVVITGDENGDSAVDWQDAAIAAREKKVIHIPANSEGIADLVTTRIAMNFQSQATQPFLTSLDNVKRVALNSDGLGQSILLKGYANEGHDSGHPDYYDIGQRMGGVDDMLTMLKEGQKYGAEFGIHVNASEFYPEADAFSEDMVKRSGSSLSYGWNWLDQGIGINGVYDLASGNRYNRFSLLHDLVGNELDYVYVDVWGNYTSGSEDAWQTRKLSNEITSLGWRIVHEWGYANEFDSTFQHWVSDFTYGGYDQKGKLNSTIMRFLLNGYKDSFVPDFPTYGGAANAPLLGGPVMQGFEGWQGDVEYDLFIDNLYNQMVPTKFLQHYDVMKWVNNDEAVAIPYGTSSGGFSGSQTSQWTPEVQLTLAGEGDTVVVTRGSDAEINETYAYATAADRVEYRSRYITLNGKVVLTGASDPGDFTGNAPAGDMKYLIPWFWDVDGNRVASDDEKLYHYNLLGGESTWELPDGWETLATVKVYKLTDQGRTEERTVSVSNGWITLTGIEAKTPYVVVKGENGAAAPTVQWSTGAHLSDVSFNGSLTDSWTVAGTGTAQVVSTGHDIPMLQVTGEVSVSQALTDLTPGQKYAVFVGVDNRSDAKATMTLEANGEVLASNYTLRSIAKNYVASDVHNSNHATESGSSYFQNMYVFFTAPASGTVTLTLAREAGEGNTYFDDVRVVKNESQHYTYDEAGNVVSFTQDFENVAQGLFPFVVGPAQGVTDGRVHLSEKHAPFTQAGWDAKKMDDVLNGDWSVKINGLVGYNNVIYYTIPQNFHFEPGVTYTVSFDYQMGSNGTFEVVYGSGTYNGNVTAVPLEMSLGNTKTCTFTVIGDKSGQTWFGIRSTSVGGDTQGTTGGPANFGGYNDFVLDNLYIVVSSTQKNELSELIARADLMQEDDYSGDWSAFQEALTAAKTVMNNNDATQEEVDQAANNLKEAMEALTKLETAIHGVVTDKNGNPVAGAEVILEDSSYIPTGRTTVTNSEGAYVFDNMSVGSYQVKIVAEGYDVVTLNAVRIPGGEVTTMDVALTEQMVAAYMNDYDDGDVSMMKPMAGNGGNGANEEIEAVEFDGSGALKVTYGNYERNTVVDDTIQMVNGTMEVDVTPLTEGRRFGITLRGQDLSNRIYVGPFDNAGRWGWNCFVNGAEKWSAEYAGPGMYANVTRHVKITLDDTTLSLWVDGVLLMDKVTISSMPTTEGYIGFNAGRHPGSAFIFDNLRITPADTPAAQHALTGKVTDENGNALANVVVSVLQDGGLVTRTTTDVNGEYETLTLPAGTYTVQFSAEGYESKTVEVTVEDAAVTLETVALSKRSTVDKSALKALVDTCEKVDNEDYTDSSWNAFTAALDAANEVLEDDTATQDQVDAAKNALQKAYAGLKKKPTESDEPVDPDKPAKPTKPAEPDSQRFTDVPDGLWYSDAVNFVTKRGLFQGTSATEFSPFLSMNRAMVVTILWRMEGQPESVVKASFEDVTAGTWYAEAVDWAAEQGIVSGFSRTEFSPETPVTREQFAVMLFNYAKWKGMDVSADLTAIESYSDNHKVADWAKNAMAWAVENGIITGKGAGVLDPKGTANRAEVAVMLTRFL